MFDEYFLKWFRSETQKKWSRYKERDPNELTSIQVSNCDFQKDSHWLDGLSELEISNIEQHWNFKFPPDYRLFLKILHTIDRPLICPDFDGKYRYTPSFYNWVEETHRLNEAFNNVEEGILFDTEYNNLWLTSWGNKPESFSKRKEKVHELISRAPKLIPIFGHRYLLAEPCISGNPVLSIVQSDIILYSNNLRNYFIAEFLSPEHNNKILLHSNKMDKIPFWQELIEQN